MRRISTRVGFVLLFVITCNLVAATQVGTRNSDSWGVLAGSVASVDQKTQTINLLVRSGMVTAPKVWAQDKVFKFSDLQLRVMPGAVPLRVAFSDNTTIWKAIDSRLVPQAQSLERIEPGSSVLVELQAGQGWSSKETGPVATLSLSAARLILLQACIEESCTKVKCKGTKDCKEKVCDCPTAK